MRRTPGLVVAFAAALAAASTLAPGATAAPAAVSGYVVVLEDGAGPPAAVAERLADRYGGEVGFVYSHALRGFSIRTTERAAAALASNPNVDYVEADGVMSVAEQTTPFGVMRVNALTTAAINGSDERVDVDVAIIDTGIDLDHQDLNVRQDGVNCLSGSCVTGGDDDHYHGTHVAGTVGALDNTIGVVGVAPGARLWPVKVLNRRGSGSTSVVIAGVEWVTARASTIEVANLSLGGSYSSAMNEAVRGAYEAGVSVVVAAGNSAKNVQGYSPASERTAITVSALADYDGLPDGLWTGTKCLSDSDDTFGYFSNFGDNDDADGAASAVDMIAPGVCIYSTSPGGGYRTLSGTSMAAPHVAGAVALLRSKPSTEPTEPSDLVADRTAAESALFLHSSDKWNGSDDPDGSNEPLLDVSNSVFTPTFDTGGGTGGGDDGGGDTGGGDTTDLTFSPSSTNQGSTWTAIVTVRGSTSTNYSGTWSPTPPQNANAETGCSTTDSTTTCTFRWSGIRKNVGSVTWTYSTDTSKKVTISKP